MKQYITVARVRSLMAGAHSEREAAAILRAHRIRYTFSTAGGIYHIGIRSRSGYIRIIRTASRSAPLAVTLLREAAPLRSQVLVPVYSPAPAPRILNY